MMKGTLTLIPTPIEELGQLEQTAKNLLLERATTYSSQSLFVIEDLKPGRRRWLHWGLPREIVEQFVLYNEHTAVEVAEQLVQKLKSGFNVYLMSDGGLPAFCDPGIELVDRCHQMAIKVTATPFPNSISLGLALSGFDHRRFIFEGFLPLDQEERKNRLLSAISFPATVVLMDTPYRLKKLLEELSQNMRSNNIVRPLFVAMDLNRDNEELLRGTADELLAKIKDFKREFILILGQSASSSIKRGKR